MFNKELGHGRYQPSVFAFFPSTARGHGCMAKRGKVSGKLSHCLACGPKGSDRHDDQSGNRKEWEESVGIRRASKASRTAAKGMRHAASAALNPKDFTHGPVAANA